MYIFNYKMFHQEASVETIKFIKLFSNIVNFFIHLDEGSLKLHFMYMLTMFNSVVVKIDGS